MKLWMIVTPKGNPASDCEGAACAAKTRKECLRQWCWDTVYGGTIEAEVWAGWQKLGYRAVRVTVTPC